MMISSIACLKPCIVVIFVLSLGLCGPRKNLAACRTHQGSAELSRCPIGTNFEWQSPSLVLSPFRRAFVGRTFGSHQNTSSSSFPSPLHTLGPVWPPVRQHDISPLAMLQEQKSGGICLRNSRLRESSAC